MERKSQFAIDEQGGRWLQARTLLPNGSTLLIAAPRPTVKLLNIFADEILLPVLEGGAVALVLSLILAFALSRWVADPLQSLVIAARKFPSETTAPVPARGPHEVQDLTRAFNSMVTRVHATQKSQRDFVANVSHELKTPLTSIQGFAQSLLDGAADSSEARRQAAQIIHDEAGRMHRLALDLLDLARLEGGTADLNMTSVDMHGLLRNIAEKFSLQAQKANVDLRLDTAELPSIVGDGDRLAQVFTNLIDNALKFTPANGIVTVSAKNAGAWLEVAVADSGVGVSEEALPRLFDRFYQVDSSRAGGESHGAGLGLAIAREIVQAHGGKIGVQSSVGHGTTFTISLPLARK